MASDLSVITRGGRRNTALMWAAIDAANARSIALGGGPLVMTQGGHNNNTVVASGFTHNGDAGDWSIRGLTRAQCAIQIESLRWAGIFASLRTRTALWGVRAQGFSVAHIHGVPNGWGRPHASAHRQALAYRQGRDGLNSNGPDAGGPGHVATYRHRYAPITTYTPAKQPAPTPTPSPPDTRTDLERMLDAMKTEDLEGLIYKVLARFHGDDGARAIGRAQQGAWQALGSAPIKGRDDEWGATLRDSIARAAYRAGVAATLSTQILAALSKATPAAVDARALAAELAPLIPGVSSSMTVEEIAAEVRREIGEALTAS